MENLAMARTLLHNGGMTMYNTERLLAFIALVEPFRYGYVPARHVIKVRWAQIEPAVSTALPFDHFLI